MAPKLEHSLICDDIRLEATKKVTLVGVYGKYMFLPPEAKLPGRVPQLCLFTRWSGLLGGEKVYVAVDHDGAELIKPTNPNLVPKPEFPEDFSQLSFAFPGFPLKGFGEYRFRIALDSADKTVGEVVLHVGPQPVPAG